MSVRLAAVFLAAFCATAVADLPAAAAYSAAHGENALLVAEGRRIVFERGVSLDLPQRIFSMTKSLVSMGVFRDVLAGGISLGHPVSSGAARGVSVADLLNQTSGLAPMSAEFYSTGLRDKARVLKMLEPPRRSRGFAYGPSHWEVLNGEMALSHGEKLEGWMRKFVPGARANVLVRWRRDGRGRAFFSTGARMSARELLPAGREVLAGMGRGRGRWPAEVRQWLASGTPQNRMYAMGFWLNRAAGGVSAREIPVESSLIPPPSAEFWRHGCLSREAPTDLIAMIGSGGQRVYVVPSRNLIIIRLSRGGRFSDAEFLKRYFAAPSKAKAGVG